MRFFLFCVGVMAATAHAQVFSFLPSGPAAPIAASVPGPRPARGAIVSVDSDALRAFFTTAPAERAGAFLPEYGLAITLPAPDGTLVQCIIASSPVMEAPLAARFPDVRTVIVQASDGSATGRLELTPRGLTGMLRATSGRTWMIDLWQSADPSHVIVYWLDDLPGGTDWTCHTAAAVPAGNAGPQGYAPRTLQTLRTVRLAMACTGEYGLRQCALQGHAGNVADPLAAIVTVVSRANVVYEADLAVHFSLVANNDQIIYFNPATDPYPDSCDGTGGADCSGPYLSTNINNLSTVIGNANFDIGHILTRVFGGVAYLNAVCNSSTKAGGVSGIPRGGDLDPFSALVAIHEMGHQFGANHTFSGTRGRCAGNVNLSTAWEAGSGSSPMAYAGGCPVGDAPPTDNVAIFADPFFNHGSILEMQAFLGSISCPVQTTTSNSIPVVTSVTASTSIPPSTPFTLTAAATDADLETLTYSWEQYDAGVARPLSGTDAVDNGLGALFRLFPPVMSSSRTFPRMADVLSGVPTPGERLPTVTDVTRHFRVIVRDNHPGAGAVAISSLVNVAIPPGTSAFAVTSPTQGAMRWRGPGAVTWSVGGTNAAPINCANVTIRLSLNDGTTFPTVLGTFPNTGGATVTLPNTSAAARLRIDPIGGIFFAVSRPFSLMVACPADLDDGSGTGASDGGVTIDDLLFYLTVFSTGNSRADLDDGSGLGHPDGGVTIDDLLYYLGRFAAGC